MIPKRALGPLLLAFALLIPRPAEAFCWWNCSYTETEYPIVLAHGMYGFDSVFGVLDYWYNIPSALRAGGAEVYVTSVSQLHSPEARGEQLLEQIETIVAVTGKPKVNLIGHSHGGFDVRYVAAARPDLVASVTTVSSPHAGADLADFIDDNVDDGSFTETFITTLAEFGADLIALLSGASNPQDGVAALQSLTTEGAQAYGEAYPRGLPSTGCGHGPEFQDGIYYYSWSGTGHLTHALDVSDLMMVVSSLVYDEANDGLVGRCSSHFGRVIRDNYFFNHLDGVNQLLGLTSWFESNPKSIFRTHANRLKNLGL